MRAKLAVALAALGVVAATVPSFALTYKNLRYDVTKILWGEQPMSLTLVQPAVVASTTTVVTPATTVIATPATTVVAAPVVSEETILREIPAVLAPTSTGVAIISEIPSDLDIRREDLGRKIDTALSLGRLDAARATDLKTALALVGTREVQFRGDGYLSPKEDHILYRAMDRIGSDLDWYSDTDNQFMGMRIE